MHSIYKTFFLFEKKVLIITKEFSKNMDNTEEKNKNERIAFIKRWVEYVKTHSDKEWSMQQNVIINSALQAARQMSRKEYLDFKKKCSEIHS